MQYTTTIYPSRYLENDPLPDMNLEPRHGLSWPIAVPVVRLPSWRTAAKPLGRLSEVQYGLNRLGPRDDVWFTLLTFI